MGKVYADPELRAASHESYQELKQRHEAEAAAEAERAQDRPERLEAFWQEIGLPEFAPSRRAAREQNAARDRLLRMPPAEAWLFEHPAEMNLETCPTINALSRINRNERRRLKAARRRFNDLGVK